MSAEGLVTDGADLFWNGHQAGGRQFGCCRDRTGRVDVLKGSLISNSSCVWAIKNKVTLLIDLYDCCIFASVPFQWMQKQSLVALRRHAHVCQWYWCQLLYQFKSATTRNAKKKKKVNKSFEVFFENKDRFNIFLFFTTLTKWLISFWSILFIYCYLFVQTVKMPLVYLVPGSNLKKL